MTFIKGKYFNNKQHFTDGNVVTMVSSDNAFSFVGDLSSRHTQITDKRYARTSEWRNAREWRSQQSWRGVT